MRGGWPMINICNFCKDIYTHIAYHYTCIYIYTHIYKHTHTHTSKNILSFYKHILWRDFHWCFLTSQKPFSPWILKKNTSLEREFDTFLAWIVPKFSFEREFVTFYAWIGLIFFHGTKIFFWSFQKSNHNFSW